MLRVQQTLRDTEGKSNTISRTKRGNEKLKRAFVPLLFVSDCTFRQNIRPMTACLETDT